MKNQNDDGKFYFFLNFRIIFWIYFEKNRFELIKIFLIINRLNLYLRI